MTRRTLDERMEQQEQTVNKAKDHYDAEVSKLEKLMNKRDEVRKKELMKAIEDSDKSFEESMKFLQKGSSVGEALDVESKFSGKSHLPLLLPKKYILKKLNLEMTRYNSNKVDYYTINCETPYGREIFPIWCLRGDKLPHVKFSNLYIPVPKRPELYLTEYSGLRIL